MSSPPSGSPRLSISDLAVSSDLATLAVSSVSISVFLSESLARTSVLQASEAVSLTSKLLTWGVAGGCGWLSGGRNGGRASGSGKPRSCCSTSSLSLAKTSVDQVSDTRDIVSSPLTKINNYKFSLQPISYYLHYESSLL